MTLSSFNQQNKLLIFNFDTNLITYTDYIFLITFKLTKIKSRAPKRKYVYNIGTHLHLKEHRILDDII